MLQVEKIHNMESLILVSDFMVNYRLKIVYGHGISMEFMESLKRIHKDSFCTSG